jgi:hypothetical protein
LTCLWEPLIPRARVATSWSAMHVWPRFTTLLRQSTIRRRMTLHSSCVAELDTQLPRYGLRKRTAHHMASDGKSHEDATRHYSLPKRHKRTPSFTRAQSPSSRSSAKNRTIEGLGGRRTRKDQDKAWFAEAILEESDTQCLMMCESVYEGAQCDTTMKPKVHRVPVQGQNL